MDICKNRTPNPGAVTGGGDTSSSTSSPSFEGHTVPTGPAREVTGMSLAERRARRIISGRTVEYFGFSNEEGGRSSRSSASSGLLMSSAETLVPVAPLKASTGWGGRATPSQGSDTLRGHSNPVPCGSGTSSRSSSSAFFYPAYQADGGSIFSPPELVERLLHVFAPYPIPTLMVSGEGGQSKNSEGGADKVQQDGIGSSKYLSHKDYWKEAFLSSRTPTAQCTCIALLVCVEPTHFFRLVRPCASLECWMEMTRVNVNEQIPTLWEALRYQYNFVMKRNPQERFFYDSPFRTRYCSSRAASECISFLHNYQKEANGRLVIHYNGHGLPPATNKGEIWMVDDARPCFDSFSIKKVALNLDGPVIIVLDVASAGAVLNSWKRDRLPEVKPNICFLCACSEGEWLPQQPELPADLLTACLTTPLRMSITWHLYRSSQRFLKPKVHKEWVEQQIASPNLPLFQCLDLVLNAVLDTVAWCTLPDASIYYALFRVDNTTRTLFRHFVLANYVGHGAGCHPVSHPPFRPEATQHYMWDCWEYTLDKALSLLNPEEDPLGVIVKEQTSEITDTFFDEQLTTFKLWIQRGESYSTCSGEGRTVGERNLYWEEEERLVEEAADVLPCILLVLGQPTYSLRAIALLIRYMDVSRAAAKSAIYCGVLTYLYRLCEKYSPLLLLVMVLWMESVRADLKMASEKLQETANMVWMIHALRLREGATELIVVDPDNLGVTGIGKGKILELIARASPLASATQVAKSNSHHNYSAQKQPLQPTITTTKGKQIEEKKRSDSSAGNPPRQPTVLPQQKPPSSSSLPLPPSARLTKEVTSEEPLQPLRKSTEIGKEAPSSEPGRRRKKNAVKERCILLRGLSLEHCQAMVCYTLCQFMSLGVEQCVSCWNANLFGLAYPLVSMGYEGGGGAGSMLDTTAVLPVPGAGRRASSPTQAGLDFPTSLTATLELCSWGCLVLTSLFKGLRYAQAFASKFFSRGVRQFALLRHVSNTVRSSYITLLGTVVGVPPSCSTEQEHARQMQMEKKLLFQIREGIMYDPSVMVRREVIYFACQLLYAYYLMVEEEEEDFSRIESYVLWPVTSPSDFLACKTQNNLDSSGQISPRTEDRGMEKPEREEEGKKDDQARTVESTSSLPDTRKWDQWRLEEPEVRVQSSLHASKPTDNAWFADLNLPVVQTISADDPPPSSRLTLKSVKDQVIRDIIVGIVQDSALILRRLYAYGDEEPIRSALQELAMGKRPTSQRLEDESRRTMSSVGLRDMDMYPSSYFFPDPSLNGTQLSSTEPSSAFSSFPGPARGPWKSLPTPSGRTGIGPTTSLATLPPASPGMMVSHNEQPGKHHSTTQKNSTLSPTLGPSFGSYSRKDGGGGVSVHMPFHVHNPYGRVQPHVGCYFHHTEAERIRTRWNEDAMRDIVGDMIDRTVLEPDRHLSSPLCGTPLNSSLPSMSCAFGGSVPAVSGGDGGIRFQGARSISQRGVCADQSGGLDLPNPTCRNFTVSATSSPYFPISSSSFATHQLLPSIISKDDPVRCAAFFVLEPQLIVVTQSQKLYTINYERYYYQEVIEEYSLLEDSFCEGSSCSPTSSSFRHHSRSSALRSPIRSLIVINDLSVHSAFLAVTQRGSFVLLKESTFHPPSLVRDRRRRCFSSARPTTPPQCGPTSLSCQYSDKSSRRSLNNTSLREGCDENEEEEEEREHGTEYDNGRTGSSSSFSNPNNNSGGGGAAARSSSNVHRYLQTVGTFSAAVFPPLDYSSRTSQNGSSLQKYDLPLCCSYVPHDAVLFYGGCIGPEGQVAIKALSLADERVVDDLHVVSSSPLTALSADLDRRSVYAGFQDGYIRYYDDRQGAGMKMTEMAKEMCGGRSSASTGGLPGSRGSHSRVSPAVIDLGPISSITASLVGGNVMGGSGHTVVAATALGVYIYDTRKWREPTTFLSHVALYEAENYSSFPVSSREPGESSIGSENRPSSPPLLTRCSISAYAGVLGVCFADHHYGAFTIRGQLLSQRLLFPTSFSASPCVQKKKEKSGGKNLTQAANERIRGCCDPNSCITHPIRPFMSMAGDVLFFE